MSKQLSKGARLLIAALLASFSLGSAAGSNPAHISADASVGETLYVKRGCYQCHGLVGQGSILSGPSLVPMKFTSEIFARIVRNPPRAMPPYTRESLSDVELAEIEQYVRSLPAPKPPHEIPLLRPGPVSDAPEAAKDAPPR